MVTVKDNRSEQSFFELLFPAPRRGEFLGPLFSVGMVFCVAWYFPCLRKLAECAELLQGQQRPFPCGGIWREAESSAHCLHSFSIAGV